MSWAPAFNALASRNIQDQFRFAVRAVNRQASRFRIWGNSQQATVPLAHRTG